MKLLVLADIHGDIENIEYIDSDIRRCEGIVIAGDITDFGGRDQAVGVLSGFQKYQKPIFAVPGNCDLPGVDEVLRRNRCNLHGSCIEHEGLKFVGIGGSLPCPGRTPNEAGENDFRAVLEKGIAAFEAKNNLVLVTHQPAWGTELDITVSGRHTGSQAVREFIEQYQPLLAVSGHMHEASGVDEIEKTMLVNPGPFRQGRYAVVEIDDKQVNVQLYP